MSSTRSGHIVSETEQLLLYSIPGSIFMLYCAFFLFLFDRLPLSTEHIAAAALASIPVGFLLYQAYTANFLWIYEKLWKRSKETTVKFLESELKSFGVTSLNDKDLYRLSKRILTYIKNTTPEGDYIWRLVGIVNSRGVCLFCTLLASMMPIMAYVLSSVLGLFHVITLYTPIELGKIILFYIVLLICGCCLYCGIPKVKAQLDIYDRFLVCQNITKVKDIAKSWIDVKKESP